MPPWRRIIRPVVLTKAVMAKPFESVPVPVSGLVTTTFHCPAAALVMGQVPEESVVEFVKVNPVQEISLCAVLVSFTVAPKTKFAPVTLVMEAEPELTPPRGLMAVTVTTPATEG